QQTDEEQRSEPRDQRAVVPRQDAAVDRLLDHQRRRDGADLPQQPGQGCPEDARALRADDGAHEPPRRAPLRVVLPHRRKYPEMSNPSPRPAVRGIVTVPPASFSDGGAPLDPDTAAAAARRMIEEGAAIVDGGGESTRPGHEPVALDEELRRV